MPNTALPFLRPNTTPTVASALPTWVSDPEEVNRLGAYDFYDDLFDNSPEQFKLMLRGDPSDEPIYIPTAKQIVKTLARYVARGLGFAVSSASGDPVDTASYASVVTAYGELFKRERFFSRFSAEKKWGLVRGDMCWWVMADPVKAAGSRLSIRPLDPRAYFPIYDLDDPDRLLGCDIAHQLEIDNKQYVRRERYIKPAHPDHPLNTGDVVPTGRPIAREIAIFELSGWDDTEKQRLFATELPMTLMPKEITALPVYHIRVDEQSYNPYGRSVLSGMERIFLAINQGATDEDVALAMAGLGFFATDQQTEDGEDWVIGPKRVVETGPGGKFERVNGVPTVDPSQKHISYLKSEVFGSLGINEVSTGGSIDVAVAESGVALAIRLGPIVDESDEIDLVIKDVLTQMFYDLVGWFAAYEGITIPDTVQVVPSFGEKMPANKQARLDNLRNLMLDRVVSRKWYRSVVAEELGLTIPDDIQTQIDDEQAQEAATLDPYAQRTTAEIGLGGPVPGGAGGA